MSNLGNTEDTERHRDFWMQLVKKFDRLRFKNKKTNWSNFPTGSCPLFIFRPFYRVFEL